jgi:elongation factor Ts
MLNEKRLETMEVTAELIKRLRDRTGAGMMDCKRALEASGGDLDGAIEFLRKKGAALAQKRAERSANEGVIVARVTQGGKLAVLVEVNCETDFVARSEDFINFSNLVADTLVVHHPSDISGAGALVTITGRTIKEMNDELLSKIGEKIEVRRFKILQTGEGTIGSYIHLGNKIGVLIGIDGPGTGEGINTLGRNLAMQVAAMNPLVVSREKVKQDTIDRELDIYRTQALNEGKPAPIVEKIAKGKLEKFFQEVCLLEQIYIRDSGKTVREYINETATQLGVQVTVGTFERFQLGEETA